MARPTLTITSRNYGTWSLRGWMLCKLVGLDFDEITLDADSPELRSTAPSFRVPSLNIDGVEMNGVLAKYCASVLELPAMVEWLAAAESEPDRIEELDAEF